MHFVKVNPSQVKKKILIVKMLLNEWKDIKKKQILTENTQKDENMITYFHAKIFHLFPLA